MTNRQIFLSHLAQTSQAPLMLEIVRAKGIYLWDINQKRYMDLIAGISVSNIGHCNDKVVAAIKQQLDAYMHLMVYGEIIQNPQVQFAKLLTEQLTNNLDSVYLTNSGSEANEGALKLAKRFTGRSEIVACHNAYHGSTHGALSVMGNDFFKNNFMPLLPQIKFIKFNDVTDLQHITEKTACVIIEPIQAEAGVICPKDDYLKLLRNRCDQTNTLLIFDEVQTGFGRTGQLFAFQKYNVVPDILTIAKAMGGGMPIGAFVSSKLIMNSLTHNPYLGHITTFGGHPVCAAAALANLEVLLNDNIISEVENKASLFKNNIISDKIKSISSSGLLMSVELESEELVKNFIAAGLELGFLSDWFLFEAKKFRLAPPLTITNQEIMEACNLINQALENLGSVNF